MLFTAKDHHHPNSRACQISAARPSERGSIFSPSLPPPPAPVPKACRTSKHTIESPHWPLRFASHRPAHSTPHHTALATSSVHAPRIPPPNQCFASVWPFGPSARRPGSSSEQVVVQLRFPAMAAFLRTPTCSPVGKPATPATPTSSIVTG